MNTRLHTPSLMIKAIFLISLATMGTSMDSGVQTMIDQWNDIRNDAHTRVTELHDSWKMSNWQKAACGASFLGNAPPELIGLATGTATDFATAMGWIHLCEKQYHDAADFTNVLKKLSATPQSLTTPLHFVFHDSIEPLKQAVKKFVIECVCDLLVHRAKQRGVTVAAAQATVDLAHATEEAFWGARVLEAGEEEAINAMLAGTEHVITTEARNEATEEVARHTVNRVAEFATGWIPIIGSLVCGTVSAVCMNDITQDLSDDFNRKYHTAIDELFDKAIKLMKEMAIRVEERIKRRMEERMNN